MAAKINAVKAGILLMPHWPLSLVAHNARLGPQEAAQDGRTGPEFGRKSNAVNASHHGVQVSEPLVAGNFFACTISLDSTLKGQERSRMDEVAVYEVRNGKIISEQFFY